MKYKSRLISAMIVALGLPLASHADSILTQAQITQIVKDVATIDPAKGAHPSVMKETVQGNQSVRTGIESRAELLFNDHTITRLGANTHFSFVEGTRNMSLQSGVMLLQVPKGIGGAKIQTAAVTAAVTGTTIMVEAGKNYTKLIVLEGECCLWPKNEKGGKQVFKHKSCATEGQEIILRNGSKVIPDPVYVNLKLLEGTSGLVTGPWNSPLNNGPIQTAANGQTPGNYDPTNLAIIGAGTNVTIIQSEGPPSSPPTTPQGGGTTPSPGGPPSPYGPLTTITNPNPYLVGPNSNINTDPSITTGGATGYGKIYRGTILDGSPVDALFGAGSGVSFPSLHVDSDFPNYGVAAFRFSNLNIQGMPSFQVAGNGASDLALVSLGGITFSSSTPTILDFSQLRELDLFTDGGTIDIQANVTISGLSKSLELYSYGVANNIIIDGNVEFAGGEETPGIEPGIQGNIIQPDAVHVNEEEDDGGEADTAFKAYTQGSYTQNGSIDANTVDVQAGSYTQNGDIGDNVVVSDVTVLSQGALTENGQIYANSIDLEAQGAFGGTGGLNGNYITLAGSGVMSLNESYIDEEEQVDTVNGVSVNVNYPLYSLSITGNEVDITAGFNGWPQGYYGPTVDLTLNSNAGDDLPGNITLSGVINVDNLDATAANNITADDTSNISSNNDFQLNAGGNVEIDGVVQAYTIELTGGTNVTISGSANLTGNNGTQITATSGSVDVEGQVTDYSYITINAGGDITTGSNSSLTAGSDGPGPITITSTGGTNTVTLDGNINASTLDITGYNVHTLSTNGDSVGITGETAINIYATNNVTLDGNLYTSSLNITGINNEPVPANVTIPVTADISADNVTIDAGIVEVEGFVGGYENDFGSTLFSVDTTSSNVTLPYENGVDGDTQQDFFSTSGSGAIDAQTIQINSRGDLILNTADVDESTVPIVNGVQVDPYGDLTELDLTGATIEVPNGYTNIESTLNLTSTGGNIMISGNIDLGTDNDTASSFSANASGNIAFSGEYAITADTITLTANQITSPSDPTLAGGNITVNANGANITLSQDVETTSTFYINEFDPEEENLVGSLTLDTSSNTGPSLSVSGNSLIVSDINASSFDSFTLSLTSLNDINAGDSATITAATSVALQVGVTADLAGDGNSNIYYNGGQLTIDDTYLGSLSVTAQTIIVDGGFPNLSDTSLTLTANGEDEDTGSINVNTDLNIASGNFTSENSDITTDAITTSDGGSLTLTANNGTILTEGALTTGSGGNITLSAASVTTEDAVTTGSGGSITITANNGGIDAQDILSTAGTGGGITLTATNGDITTGDTVTTGAGENLTITTSGTSPTGDINVDGDLSIGGTFTANASGNIFIEFADPTIGSDMSLTAAGAIEVDESVTIAGNLTLDAGTYIHTNDEATIYGASSVTLTLGAPAEISETKGGSSTLFFGVPAASEQEGYGPIGIDLTDVISGYSSVTATATSLTLTSAFNEPNVTLTLNSSSGPLVLNGAVNAFNFYAYSSGGDLTINDAVTTEQFIGTSSGSLTLNGPVNAPTDASPSANGGNLVVNGPVFTSDFDGEASGIITGSGSIFSSNIVTLSQGGAATIDQTDASHLVYDSTLTVALSSTYGYTGEVDIAAGPITLSSAISFPNVNLHLSGEINTQGNSITGYTVWLDTLQTTTGASGNSTNITATGNGYVTLEDVSLNGANGTAGSGGTLTVTGSGGDSSNVNIDFSTTAIGGSGGGNGGTITVTSQNNINTYAGSVDVSGGSGGGNGGTVSLTAQNGTIYSLDVTANGGNASSTGATAGGNGGTINLTSSSDINVNGSINANGGNARASSGAAGGNGGTVTMDSDGAINVNNYISATSGINGNTKWTGGDGGTVNLTANGTVNVNGGIQVSSSNLYTNQVSAKGGNINITSHATSGVAINIADSGQLAALLNQAAAGPGGTITFLADKGGSVNVSGSVRADAGTINIQNTTTTGTSQVSIVGDSPSSVATLSADVVKVGALGTNGTLTIGNAAINGDTAIELYAAGDNGSVVFTGPTSLSGAGLKTIAGSTVTILNGVLVNVSGGAATVYTNTPNYQGSGGNNSTTGQFTGNGATTKPFAGRPAF